ncbi:hypothetical protein FQN52_009259 [Onygenales sp. PD_12]|nr:hypothetical protein FQN52_009259 [Onygenales sp. PD_12]
MSHGIRPMATAQHDQGTRAPSSEPYCTLSPLMKNLTVLILSIAATFSGFATNIYFPVIPTIAADLSVSIELINLSVTVYLAFQAIAPILWGAFSDSQGRRIAYISSFLIFTSGCVGLAKTSHYAQLMVLRCLQSIGSASTIVVGTGILGDITTREEIGGYMGYFQAGQMLPLAIGPIVGGLFADSLGWRSIFWFLAIYSGAFIIFLFLLLPETLRSLVGNGSVPTEGISKSPLASFQQRRHRRHPPPRPTLEMETEPVPSLPSRKQPFSPLGPARILLSLETTFSLLFVSLCYSMWQMALTAISPLFNHNHNLTDSQLGLVFLANGIGCILGTTSTGKLLNIDYHRIKSNYTGPPEDFPLEHARLRTAWLWAGMQAASILVFGWTLDKHVHISVPIITTFILGWTTTSIQCVVFTFLVDVYPERGATATAALNLIRCLLGGGGAAVVFPIINRIGAGWTFTLLAGILVGGLGLLAVQVMYGPRWRSGGLAVQRAGGSGGCDLAEGLRGLRG